MCLATENLSVYWPKADDKGRYGAQDVAGIFLTTAGVSKTHHTHCSLRLEQQTTAIRRGSGTHYLSKPYFYIGFVRIS